LDVRKNNTMKYKVGDILESGEEILYVNKEFGYYETTKIKMIDSIYLDSVTNISKSSTRDKKLNKILDYYFGEV
jgi:hypothetical protein